MAKKVFINNNNKYEEVFVNNSQKLKLLGEFIELTIPNNYLCVYHKVLSYFADFGIELCNTDNLCKSKNKYILDCWYMFQSAVACHYLGKDKEADLYIDYIEKQLSNNYKGTDKEVYKGEIYFPIDENGELEALNTCNTNVDINIDLDSGIMYTENEENSFAIENSNLIVKS